MPEEFSKHPQQEKLIKELLNVQIRKLRFPLNSFLSLRSNSVPAYPVSARRSAEQTLWAAGEEGPASLSKVTFRCHIRPPSARHPESSTPASLPTLGRRSPLSPASAVHSFSRSLITFRLLDLRSVLASHATVFSVRTGTLRPLKN